MPPDKLVGYYELIYPAAKGILTDIDNIDPVDRYELLETVLTETVRKAVREYKPLTYEEMKAKNEQALRDGDITNEVFVSREKRNHESYSVETWIRKHIRWDTMDWYKARTRKTVEMQGYDFIVGHHGQGVTGDTRYLPDAGDNTTSEEVAVEMKQLFQSIREGLAAVNRLFPILLDCLEGTWYDEKKGQSLPVTWMHKKKGLQVKWKVVAERFSALVRGNWSYQKVSRMYDRMEPLLFELSKVETEKAGFTFVDGMIFRDGEKVEYVDYPLDWSKSPGVKVPSRVMLIECPLCTHETHGPNCEKCGVALPKDWKAARAKYHTVGKAKKAAKGFDSFEGEKSDHYERTETVK